MQKYNEQGLDTAARGVKCAVGSPGWRSIGQDAGVTDTQSRT